MTTALDHLLAPLAPHLRRADVTEIVVNRPGQFMVEAGPSWDTFDEPSLTLDRLDAIGILAAFNGSQDLSPEHPLCGAALPSGERLQVCRPPATLANVISLTIRKPTAREMRVDDADFLELFDGTNQRPAQRTQADGQLRALHAAGSWREFFKLAVAARKTIGVCGSVGSGKTTLLKRLLREVPASERVVTIEDTAEFGDAGPPNRINLFYGEGRANLAAEDVLKASLRMRPDRLIFQEVRGPEAFGFLRGLAAGHAGATSWHADEGREWDALALMVRQHEAGRAIPDDDMQRYLEQFIDVLVWVSRDDVGFHAPRVWMKGAAA